MPTVLFSAVSFVLLALSVGQPADKFATGRFVAKHSNLGGWGPDGGQESLIIANFASTSNGKSVTLKITASEGYVGMGRRNRVKSGAFGVINSQGSVHTDFKFTLLDEETGELADVKRFYITFYDLDGSTHSGNEAITLSGFKKYWLAPHTELTATTNGNKTTFEGSRAGTGGDNPIWPRNLTQTELDRAVTVQYDHLSEFTATFSIGKEHKRRNILFGGWSNLVDIAEPVEPVETITPSCLDPCEPIKIHIHISCSGDGSVCASANVTAQAARATEGLLRGTARLS